MNERFFKAVKNMRINQKAFFACKDDPDNKKHFLRESKQWEMIVDKLIADHDSAQTTLFTEGL